MSVARTKELANSLATMLAEATAEQRLDAAGRLAWLAQHLGIYTQRLVGSAAVPSIDPRALIQGDLFTAIEVGAAAVEAELAASAPALSTRVHWTRVRAAITDLREAGTVETIAALSERVRAWQDDVVPAEIATRLSNDRLS